MSKINNVLNHKNEDVYKLGKDEEVKEFVECRICGHRSENLISHLWTAHSMSSLEYAEKGYPLLCKAREEYQEMPTSYIVSVREAMDDSITEFPEEVAEKISQLGFSILEESILSDNGFTLHVVTKQYDEGYTETLENYYSAFGLRMIVSVVDVLLEDTDNEIKRIESLMKAKPRFYMAGPYFTPTQKETLDSLKELTDTCGEFETYWPFHDGINFGHVKGSMDYAGRREIGNSIMSENFSAIRSCDCVVALIDDRDPGTFVEIGNSVSRSIPVITYSTSDFGVNLMLSGVTIFHSRNLPDVVRIMKTFSQNVDKIREIYAAVSTDNVVEAVSLTRQLVLQEDGEILDPVE